MAPSALFAILLNLAFTPAAPQNRAQSDKLTFGANLVLVPVVVTDKHGSHVRGLTRDDFAVKKNGNVQKIASFEEITAESSAVQRPPVPLNVFTNQVIAQLLAKAQNAPVVNNTPIPGSSGDVRARSAALGALDAGLLTDPTQDKHLYMGIMADATGGRAFYNNNNLEVLFRRASQDSGEYYMLTYYTSNTGKPGWRKLDVRIHRDGVQVRHRTGFFFTNAARDPETTRQGDEVMALTSSLNFTSLPITATWQQTKPAGANRKVHFSLAIPPSATNIDIDHENRISIDFLALALGAKGQEAAKVTQRVDRKLPPAGVAQIQASGITYSNVLTLVPGEYNVHIVVRDNLTGNIGSVVAPLKVESLLRCGHPSRFPPGCRQA